MDGHDEPKSSGGALDEGIGTVVDAVPAGSPLAEFLKQFGIVGLALGVLVGNIPITAVISAAASGKGPITEDTFTTYWDVFLLVTPWVAVFAVIAYCIATETFPRMSGAGYLFSFAALVFGAGALSYSLGGPVPDGVIQGPVQGGPSGAGAYAVDSLSSYLELYGPWPVVAGIVEGGVFGFWGAVLANDDLKF
jgi:hypothetical protein